MLSRIWAVPLALLALTPACSSDEVAAGGGNDSGYNFQDSAGGPGSGDGSTTATDTGEKQYKVVSSAVQIVSAGKTIHMRRFVPDGCSAAAPCAAAVLVPDGVQSGDAFFGSRAPEVLAGTTGAIIITYNAPGRGTGVFKSAGTEDYNGQQGQDVLKDVLLALNKNQDTNEKIGVISFGYGLSAAAGALARHYEANLPFTDWLIDVEGPINRCYATEQPLDEAAGITGDGEVKDGWCDFNVAGILREDAFPTSLPEGVPKSVICNPKAFPISLTEKGCSDETWWKDREPNKFLQKLHGAYLRVQMKYDHRQPARTGALLAVYHAIQSPYLDYEQLNDVKSGTPVQVAGDAQCLQQKCYLDKSDLGNSVLLPDCQQDECTTPENPFKGVMDGYSPMSLDAFCEKVLPKYVKRLNDRI